MSAFRSLLLFLSAAAIAAALFSPVGTAAAHAQTDAATTKAGSPSKSAVLVLRWIKPTRFIELITLVQDFENKTQTISLIPSGLVRMSPDDTTGRLFMQGTPASLTQIQEISRLLDVQPRRVRLSVRILRGPANQFYEFGEPNQKLSRAAVVSSAAALYANSETIALHAMGDGRAFHLPLTPHINGDNSVTLTMDLSAFPASPPSLSFDSIIETNKTEPGGSAKRVRTKRISDGDTLLVALGPDLKNKDSAYYLEITPVVAVPTAAPRQEGP